MCPAWCHVTKYLQDILPQQIKTTEFKSAIMGFSVPEGFISRSLVQLELMELRQESVQWQNVLSALLVHSAAVQEFGAQVVFVLQDTYAGPVRISQGHLVLRYHPVIILTDSVQLDIIVLRDL